MLKKIIPLLLGFIIILLTGGKVFADSEVAPYSYKQITQDGKYVFVMLTSDKNEIKTNDGKTYMYSGLYENNNSTDPLWTVDWYSYKVYISQDGEHAAKLGPWPRLGDDRKLDLNQLAVAFYDKGNLLEEYYIKDLVIDTGRLPVSVSHFQFSKEMNFDYSTNELTFLTYDGSEYVFDISTGQITNGTIRGTESKILTVVYIILLVFIVGGVTSKIVKTGRR